MSGDRVTPADCRVWLMLSPEDWRNREDLAVLAGVTEREAAEACAKFFTGGLVVRRAAYPDYRYRRVAISGSLLTDRGRLLKAALDAAALGAFA